MYYFFRASLPVLELGSTPPFDVAGFDALAATELSECDYARLVSFNGCPARDGEGFAELPSVYRRTAEFEQCLRLTIAKRRGTSDISEPVGWFGEIDRAMTAALAAADPAARELVFDRLRWNFYDELELLHEFDFDAICVYRLKLATADKYRGRDAENGRRNFEAAAERISNQSQAMV